MKNQTSSFEAPGWNQLRAGSSTRFFLVRKDQLSKLAEQTQQQPSHKTQCSAFLFSIKPPLDELSL